MRVFLILLLACLTPAASAAPEPSVHLISADVSISAQGKVTAFSVPARFAGLEASLRTVVDRWRFKPAQLDGRPVPVDTSLRLRLSIGPGADEALQAQVELLGNGVGVAQMQPPRYPRRAMMALASALVLLELDYDANGAVTAARVLDSASTQRTFRDDFEGAAVVAARQWQFRPERVGGIGLAGTMVVPVKFHSDGGLPPPKLAPQPTVAGFDPGSDQLLTRNPTPLTRIDSEG